MPKPLAWMAFANLFCFDKFWQISFHCTRSASTPAFAAALVAVKALKSTAILRVRIALSVLRSQSKICKACPKGVWLALTTTAGDVKVPPALIRMSRITWGQQQRKCVDERTLTSIPSIGKRQGYPALHGSHFGRPFCPKSSKTRIRNHGKFSNVNIKSAVLCRQHGPPNILPREEPCSTEMGKLCARRTVDIQRCITRPQIGVETLRCLMRV